MLKKIALVDDSPPFSLLVTHLLEMGNQNSVDTYVSAEAFLMNIPKIQSYDLIILDINLPGMDGLGVLKTLKTSEATETIPVLLLSGDARTSTIVNGVQLGAKDFITKPIDPKQLIERVNFLLHNIGTGIWHNSDL